MEALQKYVMIAVNWMLENPDLVGTVAFGYIAIQAAKSILPKSTRAFAALLICAAITAFNPLRDWNVALSLMYGGLMGCAQIAIHSLGDPLAEWGLKKIMGDRDGAAAWKKMEAEAIADARNDFESTRTITPPTKLQAAAKKIHDIVT